MTSAPGMTGLAASLLAPILTAQHIGELDGFIAEMEQAAEAEDFGKFYPLNLEFHDYIVRSTGNGRLTKMYRGLVKEFHLFRSHGLVQRDALLASNREHREIVAALKARDPQVSYDVSFRHVANGKQRMLMALEDLAHTRARREPRRPRSCREPWNDDPPPSGSLEIRRGRAARSAERPCAMGGVLPRAKAKVRRDHDPGTVAGLPEQ